MTRTLLTVCLILVAVAAAGFGYLHVTRSADLRFMQVLGIPEVHSPHGRLPELAMEVLFDDAQGRVMSRQDNGDIRSWDLASGEARLIARTDGLFAYCPAKQLLIVGDAGGAVMRDLERDGSRPIAEGSYDHAAWTLDCLRFALADDEAETVEIWQAANLAKLGSIETLAPLRNGLALSLDGGFLATAEGTYGDGVGHDTALEIFTISGEGEVARSAAIDDPATILGMWKMVFVPGSESLIAGSQVGGKSGLRSFRPDGGAANWSQDGFASYWVRGLAVSPDGGVVASGDEKGFLRLWDARTGEKLFQGKTGLVIQSLSFSEDGKRLAVALWDSTIGILDVNSIDN